MIFLQYITKMILLDNNKVPHRLLKYYDKLLDETSDFDEHS